MLKPGDVITIRKAANGYIVEPLGHQHQIIAHDDVQVFNSMGVARAAGDDEAEPCLLKFIEQHFAQQGGASS